MNKLQLQIHEILKARYEKATGKKMVCQKSLSPTKSKYYFDKLEDNFYSPMSDKTKSFYQNGNGNELNDKMHALRSSAAMTYNLLGNENVILKENQIIGAGEYTVEYEKQLDTLRDSKAPANLDAFLQREEELCFCEMKLFEPIYHNTNFLREISSSYKDMESYFYTDTVFSFTKSLDKLCLSGIKRYDACQMFKHTLGIYNYARKNELKGKKITLLNCVWTLNEELQDEKLNLQYKQIAEEEKQEFRIFEQCMFDAINSFKKIGVDFSIKFVTVKEFIEMLDIPEDKVNWLNRY